MDIFDSAAAHRRQATFAVDSDRFENSLRVFLSTVCTQLAWELGNAMWHADETKEGMATDKAIRDLYLGGAGPDDIINEIIGDGREPADYRG